ncbi:MAG: hypothetical protein Tp1102DCM384591_42 [Prokaryotic dsDNA virus sp.]|nr:MAG: hypothetical protein Tp1102DCM384591_42 [Prokaryotic dsDNA virus sp.]|tara:strand:+ start:21291 stop:21677 length:387 start_codon:yes stop_codon:yes gene_type:complete
MINKNELQKVFDRLSDEKVELERVELARKPKSILKDAIDLDKRLLKSSSVMDRKYLDYVKVHQKWDNELKQYKQDVGKLINDSAEVSKALIDLGLRPNDVPEVLEANKRNAKVSQIIDDYKKLYPKIN